MESLGLQLSACFQWMIRSTVQVSILVCLILAVKAMVRGRLEARWHYCLWLLLLIRMVMPWAPESSVSVFNLVPDRADNGMHAQTWLGEATPATTGAVKANTLEATLITVPEAASVTSGMEGGSPGQTNHISFHTRGMLALIWLAGALGLGVYIFGVNLAFWIAIRREHPVNDMKVIDLLEACKAEMGIRSPLTVVETSRLKSPALFGVIRPVLLLPKQILDTLSFGELRNVFLHEMAHLKRRDIVVNWLQAVLQSLHWFNPLIWYAFYRMRMDRELACDAMALSVAGPDASREYGQTMIHLLEDFSRSQRLASLTGVLEDKSQLRRRIAMITHFKRRSYVWSVLAVVVIGALGFVALTDARNLQVTSENEGGGREQLKMLRVYEVNRAVADFDKEAEFSTPEAAYAAINRVAADGRSSDWARVSVERLAKQFSRAKPRESKVDQEWADVLLNARILEVRIWNGTHAVAMAELPQEFSSKIIRKPIDVRHLKLEKGRWLNTGNDRADSVPEGRTIFDRVISRVKPKQATKPQSAQYSVRLVVGEDKMTFEGREVTWERLPGLLNSVPNRSQTVLELAVASKQMTVGQFDQARGRASRLREKLGFNHLSYIGEHPLGSRGGEAPDAKSTRLEGRLGGHKDARGNPVDGAAENKGGLSADGQIPNDRRLNEAQQLYRDWTAQRFGRIESRYGDMTEEERATREEEWLRELEKGSGRAVIPAINGLAAMRSRKAVPALLRTAAERREKDNRDRWMAVRALGLTGDNSVVPELVHLTYHYNQNTRFWAQISLVRLTGQNFGRDVGTWRRWWEERGGKPPVSDRTVTWTTRTDWANPEAQEASDRKFVEKLKSKKVGTG